MALGGEGILTLPSTLFRAWYFSCDASFDSCFAKMVRCATILPLFTSIAAATSLLLKTAQHSYVMLYGGSLARSSAWRKVDCLSRMAQVRPALKVHPEQRKESNLATYQPYTGAVHPYGPWGRRRETRVPGDLKMRNLSSNASKIRQQLSSHFCH